MGVKEPRPKWWVIPLSMTFTANAKGKTLTAGLAVAPWTDDPDIALMLRIQNDDAGAFAELIQRYRGRIQGHIVKRLGDLEDAEDLTQEVFLRLFRYRKRYQPTARLTTLLYHITHNVTCNALRSQHHRKSRLLQSSAGAVRNQGSIQDSSNNGPSERVERSEAALIVRDAVRNLGRRQRAAVELYQFQNHSYAQLAAELAMTPKAAKSLLYRARSHLRSALSGYMS
jgi:RNA polymerase sigma-70 factor, ECF subfamily